MKFKFLINDTLYRKFKFLVIKYGKTLSSYITYKCCVLGFNLIFIYLQLYLRAIIKIVLPTLRSIFNQPIMVTII